MKHFFKYAFRSLPMVCGLILTLTSLSFLIGFATDINVEKLQDEEYSMFLVFAVIGIPTLLFGINYLANYSSASSDSHKSTDLCEFREPGSN